MDKRDKTITLTFRERMMLLDAMACREEKSFVGPTPEEKAVIEKLGPDPLSDGDYVGCKHTSG